MEGQISIVENVVMQKFHKIRAMALGGDLRARFAVSILLPISIVGFCLPQAPLF